MMTNQAAVEALYSATFAEDYLDTVEDLPNDLQRHLSRLREHDLTQYREFLCDLDKLIDTFESETTLSGQRQVLAKIQKGLILTQDIGDDKLAVVQNIADLIEAKARLLEHDAKNLDFGKDDAEDDEADVTESRPATSSAHEKSSKKQGGSSGKATASAGSKKSSSAAHDRDRDDKADKSSAAAKRRKKQQESRGREDRDDDEQSTTSSRSNTKSRSSTGAGQGGNGSAKKPASSKRKSAAAANKSSSRAANHDKDDSDREEIDLGNIEIDPDEPTYCLCDQVSYGDMIGCDNDLCPIEWFHFNCVQLTSKPKGRWYCPKCRGDKATVMKPKAQFLKELEKYNNERKEKMAKHNS